MVTFLAQAMRWWLLTVPVSAWFQVVHPSLEGQFTLNRSFHFWHLGGFCFGGRDVAARLRLEVDYAGPAAIYLAGYDGREAWWQAGSCSERLQRAEDHLKVHQGRMNLDLEHHSSGLRDWHFALLSCEVELPVPVAVKLVAEEGAFSVFGHLAHLDSSSCPQPVGWFAHARPHFAFWALQLLVVSLGSLLGLWLRSAKRKVSALAPAGAWVEGKAQGLC